MTAAQLNTELCFEPAERSKKDHAIFDTNRNTEKNLGESSKENLGLKFYLEPKSLPRLV